MLLDIQSIMLDTFIAQIDAEPFRDNSKSNSCGGATRQQQLYPEKLVSVVLVLQSTSWDVWSDLVVTSHEEGRTCFLREPHGLLITRHLPCETGLVDPILANRHDCCHCRPGWLYVSLLSCLCPQSTTTRNNMPPTNQCDVSPV